MPLDVAVAILKRYVDDAKSFRIICDGHGSFTLETGSHVLADRVAEFLRTLSWQPQILERPFFYRIH